MTTEDIYEYQAGEQHLQKLRFDGKQFRWQRYDNGDWISGLNGAQPGLYQSNELAGAIQKKMTIYVVEGEKAVNRLQEMFLTATCSPMGAGHWKPEYSEVLRGADVVILPDNDQPGRDHAARVAAELHGKARRVRVLELPGLPEKADVYDWMEAGGTETELIKLANAIPDWEPPQATPVPGARVGGWEIPIPFEAHELPPFPVEAMPGPLAGMVTEVAASLQVPPDMPAMIGIAAVGAAAAVREIDVRIGDTHTEPSNLYVVTVMPPGNRKSGVMVEMTTPLRNAEREMVAAATGDVAAAKQRRMVEEKRLVQLRDDVVKTVDAALSAKLMAELETAAANLTNVPTLPRLLADDATPEALAVITAEQNGKIGIFSAEGTIFSIVGGRYSDGKANLDLVLKGHSGEEFRVDRKNSPPLFIPRTCLTIAVAVQPDVIRSLGDSPTFRGRGLVGRFLYSVPGNIIGTRMYQNRPICPQVRRGYEQAINAILALPGAVTAQDPAGRHLLKLEGAALKIWADYYDDVERRQAEGGDLARIPDWASKLAGSVARIAANFHLVEHAGTGKPWDVPIAPHTVSAAWAVGEYLIPHALAALGMMGADPKMTLARRLLHWIERRGLAEFSLRECYQAHRDVGSPRDLEPALAMLCERNYLRLRDAEPRRGAGQPKSPIYEVNPRTHNAHNTQK